MFLRRKDGFTTLELLAVVTIIALLGSTAALSIPPLLDLYRLKQEENQLVSTIREAQVRAVEEGRPWRVLLASDGRSYQLQHATSMGASGACDPAGWETVRTQVLQDGHTMQDFSRECVPFGSTGRGLWPPAQIQNTVPTPWAGATAVFRLADGIELQSPPPKWNNTGEAASDPAVVAFNKVFPSTTTVATFTLNLDEVRHFGKVCLGLVSWPLSSAFANGIRYPRTIKVEAAGADGASWSTLYNGAGPTNPALGVRERKCFDITVNGDYQYFRVTLEYDSVSRWAFVDEFTAANLYVTLQGPRSARRLGVAPVSGRITVQSVSP